LHDINILTEIWTAEERLLHAIYCYDHLTWCRSLL